MVTREVLEHYNYVPIKKNSDKVLNKLISIVAVLVAVLIVI